ncbi:MAG: CsbD family protein [Thermoanaerobaculaceae bacterium]|nr:CsbD family protein [Thermoanaerobaculaceae bacterium]TAM53340.1 MAG: CsbD family protein [Acidobacteriota bacterium]
MRKQELRGKAKKVQGQVTETAGRITGDRALERKGARQRTEGAVQEGVGKARRKIGDLAKGIAKGIQR